MMDVGFDDGGVLSQLAAAIDAAVAGFLLEPAGGADALSSALALARAAVLSPDTAGMGISAADRAAVQLRTIDPSEFLGENTG